MEAQQNQPMNGVLRINHVERKFISQSPKSFLLPGESLSAAHEIRPTSGRKVQKSYIRGPNNEYMALRRKYLRLEEKSCEIGKELEEVRDNIKALEEAKLSLLDELIMLEDLNPN